MLVCNITAHTKIGKKIAGPSDGKTEKAISQGPIALHSGYARIIAQPWGPLFHFACVPQFQPRLTTTPFRVNDARKFLFLAISQHRVRFVFFFRTLKIHLEGGRSGKVYEAASRSFGECHKKQFEDFSKKNRRIVNTKN